MNIPPVIFFCFIDGFAFFCFTSVSSFVLVTQRCSVRKGVLRNVTKFTGKHLSQAIIKKETLAQVFSCEFCGISKTTFCYRANPVAASIYSLLLLKSVSLRVI